MLDTSHRKSLSDSILRTLLYYDIFSYPLTAHEVYKFMPTNGVSEEDVAVGLKEMASQSVVFPMDRFFSIRNEKELSDRRIRGNEMAEKIMDKAHRRAKLIARFPFVRAVMISGSLSKGFMDEKSDLDFFIVTEPGGLWIARTMLVLFKRVALFNSHKYFCVNYFVDSSHLEIGEKNLFTATELATLIPMINGNLYNELLQANPWLSSFFPNYKPRPTDQVPNAPQPFWKKPAEKIIAALFGTRLEKSLEKTTRRRWQTIYEKDYIKNDFDIAFKTNEHVSKNHPRNYQRKIIERYQEKLAGFYQLTEVPEKV